MLRRGSSTYSKRSLTSKGAQRFHTTENFARLTRSLCLLPLLRRILSSSCLEAHLGGVFGFGRELGAIILRKDAVPAQQYILELMSTLKLYGMRAAYDSGLHSGSAGWM
jgi:hypothetical protein